MNAYELAADILRTKNVTFRAFERPKVRIVARELLTVKAENAALSARVKELEGK